MDVLRRGSPPLPRYVLIVGSSTVSDFERFSEVEAVIADDGICEVIDPTFIESCRGRFAEKTGLAWHDCVNIREDLEFPPQISCGENFWQIYSQNDGARQHFIELQFPICISQFAFCASNYAILPISRKIFEGFNQH